MEETRISALNYFKAYLDTGSESSLILAQELALKYLATKFVAGEVEENLEFENEGC